MSKQRMLTVRVHQDQYNKYKEEAARQAQSLNRWAVSAMNARCRVPTESEEGTMCIWRNNEGSLSSCRGILIPKDFDAKFCPYCGKPVVVISKKEEQCV